MARRLRESGVGVYFPTKPRPMGAQLKRLDRSGARYALFVGKDEIAEGRFGLKHLGSGVQDTLDERAIVARIGGKDG